MSSLIHKLLPGRPEEFMMSVMPGDLRGKTLRHTQSEISKLVLVYCQPENEYTLVFEHEVPAPVTEGELAAEFDAYAHDFNPDDFTAKIDQNDPDHAALLDDVPDGRFGLIIRHCVAVSFIPFTFSPN
jgi:hypothetical protein